MKKIFFPLLVVLFSTISNAQLTKEQQSIKKIFFDFLKFYQKNEKKFNSFQLYKGVGKENNPPYKIQWKEVERYFTWLRTNVSYVGEEYIKNERLHFKYSDSCFKVDPEEEIPMGFDYDRWAGGQEDITYTMKWYTDPNNKFQVIIKGNKAVLRIGGDLWPGAEEKDRGWSEVPFVKEKARLNGKVGQGKWKMADNVYLAANEEKTQN